MEIRLLDIGKHKIEVIKLIRLFTGLGLKESKELTDKTPSIFKLNKPEFKFEQVKKNFDAIGAKIELVEKIEPIKEIKENNPQIPGEDLKEKTSVPKKTIKSDKIKIKKKKVWEKPTFTEKSKITSITDEKFFNINKKADEIFFVKSVKSSLTIAITGAVIYAISNFYYPVSPLFTFIIIAFIISISIRSTTGKTTRELGILAGAFTLFSYIIYPFFTNIVFSLYYGEIWYFSAPNIFFRYFSIFYPSAFIPAILAYLIASNGNLGEKLNIVFKPGNKTNKTKFNSKSYQKGKRNIRRKKRKLD
ncbi:MAG: 50S ribosomal protein L7/L12 [Bacteroidota bacterium]